MGLLALAPAIASVAGAGMGMYESQQGANSARAEADKQMNWQAGQNLAQRDFDERMSSTAYTRAVGDMKNAGLNPAVMFNSGAGAASSPTASGGGYQSAASAVASSAGDRAKLAAEAVPNAVKSAVDAIQGKLTDAQVTTAKSEAYRNEAETERLREEAERTRREQAKLDAETEKTKKESAILDPEVTVAANRGAAERAQNYPRATGAWDWLMRHVLGRK